MPSFRPAPQTAKPCGETTAIGGLAEPPSRVLKNEDDRHRDERP